ncbi:hypothetical protein FNV43_RR05097 [Rhamnella rubrinervis]|uniref:PWI domain-containing protein n=1 Tax=Rhamnella rubrinervis TaxID=2594499 RepID=A0A8K0HNB4_9ROSA|nr:hypothetical protein FNV43_RR05097 [Rhamnella rubrinervis]
MSGGFFRGTSADQDTRFSNKQAKLLKSQKFAPELEHLVDMTKVSMDVIRPWIANRVTELLGFEDEVLINFIYGLLDGKEVNGKEVQISLTGFMEKNTGKFMKELWALLISAQKNASGVPQQFLDAKQEETRKKKEEADRIANEIQRKRDKESRELEEERLKKMDGRVEMKASNDALESQSEHKLQRASSDHSEDAKETDNRNGVKSRNKISRSPHSAGRPSLSPKGSPSRSISNSYSNTRSYSGERKRSKSASRSSEARGRSVSSERVYFSPIRRSVTPHVDHPLLCIGDRHHLCDVGDRHHLCDVVDHHYLHDIVPPPLQCGVVDRLHPFYDAVDRPHLCVVVGHPHHCVVVGHPHHCDDVGHPHHCSDYGAVCLLHPFGAVCLPHPFDVVCLPHPFDVGCLPHLFDADCLLHLFSSVCPPHLHLEEVCLPHLFDVVSLPHLFGPYLPHLHAVSTSPVQRRSQRSPSSPPHRNESPVQRRSPIGDRRSTPSRSRSASSYARSSSSPTRHGSPSPIRRKSPKHQASSVQSPSRERISPYKGPLKQPRDRITYDANSGPARKPREQKLHRNSKEISEELKDSPAKVHYGEDYSPERLAGRRAMENRIHQDDMEVRIKDQNIARDSLPDERQQASYPGEDRKFDEKNHSRSKNSRQHKLESVDTLVEKLIIRIEMALLVLRKVEGGQEEEERAEEMRKEEKRRRRQERRQRRDERRAEKRKGKSQSDFSASDGDNETRKESHQNENEETESEQKKLEIELRNKALESLKAKKGFSH